MIEDLREECEKHGQVTKVVVPRPADTANAAAVFGTNNYGKVVSASGCSHQEHCDPFSSAFFCESLKNLNWKASRSKSTAH